LRWKDSGGSPPIAIPQVKLKATGAKLEEEEYKEPVPVERTPPKSVAEDASAKLSPEPKVNGSDEGAYASSPEPEPVPESPPKVASPPPRSPP